MDHKALLKLAAQLEQLGRLGNLTRKELDDAFDDESAAQACIREIMRNRVIAEPTSRLMLTGESVASILLRAKITAEPHLIKLLHEHYRNQTDVLHRYNLSVGGRDCFEKLLASDKCSVISNVLSLITCASDHPELGSTKPLVLVEESLGEINHYTFMIRPAPEGGRILEELTLEVLYPAFDGGLDQWLPQSFPEVCDLFSVLVM